MFSIPLPALSDNRCWWFWGCRFQCWYYDNLNLSSLVSLRDWGLTSDPVLTQNPKKAGRAGRKQWKTRRADGGKKHTSEPKWLRFCFGTTYGPEGRGFESLTAYQNAQIRTLYIVRNVFALEVKIGSRSWYPWSYLYYLFAKKPPRIRKTCRKGLAILTCYDGQLWTISLFLSLTLGEIILDSRAHLALGYKLLHSIYGNKGDRRTVSAVLRSPL